MRFLIPMLLFPAWALALLGCRTSVGEATDDTAPPEHVADVVSVEVTGPPGAYRFAVGITSPDTGCDRYADWWEVVTESGELVYRRVLAHSHVGEQPFVRSGGPVEIAADQPVWIRAHMHPEGYGGVVFQGSVARGFRKTTLRHDFAAGLARRPPLPAGCAG